MKLSDKQIRIYIGEAAEYEERAAFMSDVVLSVLPEDVDVEDEFCEQIARLWDVARLPFRDLLAAIGLGQTACSVRFCIPLKTIQHWCGTGGEARACTLYIRMMISELTGYLDIREGSVHEI